MKYTIFCSLITGLVFHCYAYDVLEGKNGRTYNAKVLSYVDGVFTVQLMDGAIRQANATAFKSIKFGDSGTVSTNSVVGLSDTKGPTTGGSISSATDFRSARWGMSLTEVKATEENKPIRETENLAAYSDQILGNEVLVVYFFVNNKLVRTQYRVLNEYKNENKFFDDFNLLFDYLCEKYGTSAIKKFWDNDLYKDDSSRWGFAVSIGHLSWYASWETRASKITLYLDGENYKINVGVEYASKQLEALEKNERKEKANKAL